MALWRTDNHNMTKLISVLLAIITALSGYLTSAFQGSLTALVGGAVSLVNGGAEFLNSLGDDDVSQFDENTGYVKNMLLIFFDGDATLLAKLRAVDKTGGAAVGGMAETGLCVVRTAGLNYEKLTALADKISELEGVALASVCPANRLSEQYTPDDPFSDSPDFTEMWNEGSPSGNNWWLEAIDARGAWTYQPYLSHINVGIVDGGFDLAHPELKGLITFPNKMCERRNRPDYHGTHVAGMIAAKGDNGEGICGICQNADIIGVDWSTDDGQLWIPDVEIFFGFGYAVKAGAKVINFSIGCSGSIGEEKTEFFVPFSYLDGVLYSCYMGSLLSNGYDFVVVQSAGNGNEKGRAVDASNNGVFCAINRTNCFTPYLGVSVDDVLSRIIVVGNAKSVSGTYYQSSSSNVGDTVDICAPGTSVYSCADGGGYVYLSGTSMAAPCVTGVASLVWSANEKLTGAQVKEIVCSNTKDVVLPATDYYFDGLNTKTQPLLNAKLAVEAALKTKGAVECEIEIETMSKIETVVLTDDSGRQFELELDAANKYVGVILPGDYTVSYTDNGMTNSFSKTFQ